MEVKSGIIYLDDITSISENLLYEEQRCYKGLKASVFQACYLNDPDTLKETVLPLSRKFQNFLLNSYYNEMTPLILSVCDNSDKIFNCLMDLSIFPAGVIDLEKIGSVIIDKNDPNSRVEGAPALWIASALNHLEMVKTLISRGADIEHGSLSGSTPLRCASYDGHLDICKFLVTNGAKLHAINDCDQSPLMIGAAMDKENVVKYLIQEGADIEQATSLGDTTLHITVEVASESMVELILKSGARNAPNHFGFTPLILSAAYRKVNNYKLLLENCNLCIGELVDSLKILGAVFAIEENVNATKDYWRQVECVRVKTGTPLPEIPKIPLYDNTHEPISALEIIQLDRPSMKYFRGSESFHLMVIALCIFERIFGSNHPHTAHYLRVCGDFFLQGPIGVDHQKCMDFWLRSFQYEKIRFGFEINAALDLLISLDTFIDMFDSNFYPDIYPFVQWCVTELENPYTRITYLNNLLSVLSYFFSVWIAACNQFEKTHIVRVKKDRKRMGELVKAILAVKRNVPLSLMHASLQDIEKISSRITNHNLSVYIPTDNLELFVENSAEINIIDPKTGSSLLHTAIANNCTIATVDTLLKLGIYPHLVNFTGNTAYQDMIAVTSKHHIRAVHEKFTKIEKIGKSLKTLSALVIVKHDISICNVPILLQKFVNLHKPRIDCIKLEKFGNLHTIC
ncbi:Protein fem-1-like protein C-like [Oopsacas minuta]|uniref:Protein fem-1-like protein C-like n=1 Tax=Oopsacas minuta TaxID=111878 RepID=A0AAV7JMN6_9METZ|nr:Protein fem-1-like protein C-like [Oopsacas minuta]